MTVATVDITGKKGRLQPRFLARVRIEGKKASAYSYTLGTSRREDIITALVARLEVPPAEVPKPAGLTVHRFAMLPIEEDDLPAVVVYWTACEPVEKDFISSPEENRLLLYSLTVRIEARVMGEPLDRKLDPLTQYIRRVIFSDPSLGGLACSAREDSIQVDAVSKAQVYAASASDFVFQYLEEPFTYAEPDFGVVKRVDYDNFDPTHLDPTGETLQVGSL